MFGRKGAEGAETEAQDSHNESTASAPRVEASSRTSSPSLARRVVPGSSSRSSASSGNDRKLTVGPGLSLAGEIASCDILVVEGKVEAKLSDGKLLEITESGQFRGNVEIENADIAGRYDGQLIVHGRLTVRATGRISGMVKYGELEVSAGGQIIGELQVTGANVPDQQRSPAFKSAAKFTSAVEDSSDDEAAKLAKSA